MANTLNSFRHGASLLANIFGVGFIDWLIFHLQKVIGTLTMSGADKSFGLRSSRITSGLSRHRRSVSVAAASKMACPVLRSTCTADTLPV